MDEEKVYKKKVLEKRDRGWDTERSKEVKNRKIERKKITPMNK